MRKGLLSGFCPTPIQNLSFLIFSMCCFAESIAKFSFMMVALVSETQKYRVNRAMQVEIESERLKSEEGFHYKEGQDLQRKEFRKKPAA